MKVFWVRFMHRGQTRAKFVDAACRKDAKRMVRGRVVEIVRIV
jgi:hypothetical protein